MLNLGRDAPSLRTWAPLNSPSDPRRKIPTAS